MGCKPSRHEHGLRIVDPNKTCRREDGLPEGTENLRNQRQQRRDEAPPTRQTTVVKMNVASTGRPRLPIEPEETGKGFRNRRTIAVVQQARKAGPETLCNLCARNGSETEIPLEKVTGRCSTLRTVCKECLEKHIAASVVKQHFDVKCLCHSRGCEARLSFHDIAKHATQEVFERYDQGLLHATLEKNPEFCWCSRSGCGSGQLHASKTKYPRVRCHACDFKTCFRHKCEWHAGRTCEEYDEDARKSDEVSLLQLLEHSRFRRCPRCHHAIEKNKGCDHMTCRCKHQFCWRCLAPYEGDNGIFKRGNRAHEETCKHYRP
mmetsp:Transcript_9800/g.21227  ORF Transcript_9800/g.21227 Transcript_9800/m.21227 type:complete len:319 (-) Transcript_9800:1836-2792(-)